MSGTISKAAILADIKKQLENIGEEITSYGYALDIQTKEPECELPYLTKYNYISIKKNYFSENKICPNYTI